MTAQNPPQPPLPPEDREALIAYLDGELPPAESAAIELQIRSNEQYRRELYIMTQVWDALDELPPPALTNDFAKTTLELVTSEVRDQYDTLTAALPALQRKRWMLLVAAFVIATLAGFTAMAMLVGDPNDDLLTDLPIVQRLGIYSEIPDVQFIRELNRDRIVRSYLREQMSEQRQAEPRVELVNATLNDAARRTHIANLDPVDQAVLSRNLSRYRALSEDRRDQLREIHQLLVATEDREELMDLADQYGRWLESRTAGERAELRSYDAQQRIQKVRVMIRREQAEALHRITLAEAQQLRAVFTEFLWNRRESLARDELSQVKDKDELVRRWLEKQRRMQRMGRTVNDRMWRPAASELRVLARAVFEVLGEEREERFMQLRADDKARALMNWITQAFRPSGSMSEEELEEFFASDHLTNEDREELLALPLPQMRNELMMHRARVLGETGGRPFPARERMNRRGGGMNPPPVMDRKPSPRRPGPNRSGRLEIPAPPLNVPPP